MMETFQVGTGLWDPRSDSDLDQDATALLKKRNKGTDSVSE